MRKVLISLATAASAFAIASPAAAQWYPPQPQGHAYGYQSSYGHVRSLQARVNQLQRQINHLDRRNVLSNREAARLRQQSHDVERRLHVASRNGLHPQEAYYIENRIARLEQRIFRDARDGRNWGGNRYGQSGWVDRDRDGRDDRREDDRGWDRD